MVYACESLIRSVKIIYDASIDLYSYITIATLALPAISPYVVMSVEPAYRSIEILHNKIRSEETYAISA